MLCCVGDLAEDIVVWLPGPLQLGTDTPGVRVERRRGGSAANVAVFAAGTGTPARFVGRVGDDAVGDRLLAELVAAGVDPAVVRGGRTGSVVVLVAPDGERSMLPDRGGAVGLGPVDTGVLKGCSWLHLPAYSLLAEPVGTSCRALAAEAHRRGVRVSVDVSSAALVRQRGVHAARSAVAAVGPDLVLANLDEAEALDLLRRPFPAPTLTVVKAGPDPVRVLGAEVLTLPVPPVDEVRDTTGAGDAFAAGMLGALAAGQTVAEAVSAGCEVAARVLAVPGATLGPAPAVPAP